MATMSAASVTVAVGYTSQYPVIPDQHVSYVTVPLDFWAWFGQPDRDDVRTAEKRAMLEAFGAVAARTRGSGIWPAVSMITSLNIVQETL